MDYYILSSFFFFERSGKRFTYIYKKQLREKGERRRRDNQGVGGTYKLMNPYPAKTNPHLLFYKELRTRKSSIIMNEYRL